MLLVQTLYSKWEEEGAAWVQMQPSARFGDTDIIPSRSVRLSPEQLSLIDRHFDEVRVWRCLFHSGNLQIVPALGSFLPIVGALHGLLGSRNGSRNA